MAYADNALTPVTPRQLWHYRVHARYRPKPWATISGAFNDLERHNNTNNNQAAVAAGDDPYEGPLDHVDRTRIASVSGDADRPMITMGSTSAMPTPMSIRQPTSALTTAIRSPRTNLALILVRRR
jgi:hypothetical protein